MWYRKQLTTLLPKLIHVKTIQLKRSVDVTSVLCPGMLYLCVFSTASALIPGVYFGTFSQHSVLSIGMFLSTTTGTYLGVWSLYNHRYIPWCVVSLQVHTLVCGLSTTTGTYRGTFSLQPQVHTLVPSLYNFCTESRYWHLLSTASALTLAPALYNFSNEHRYIPWRVLSQ